MKTRNNKFYFNHLQGTDTINMGVYSEEIKELKRIAKEKEIGNELKRLRKQKGKENEQ